MNKTEVEPDSSSRPNTLIDCILEAQEWSTTNFDVEAIVYEAASSTFKELGILNTQIEISILFSNDERIAALNSDFRQKDSATNVLSFPHMELTPENYLTILSTDGIHYLGDIALSYQTIQREAMVQSKEFKNHLIHLVIHSCLHLCGYDHEENADAEIMEALEVKVLAMLGITNPYILN